MGDYKKILEGAVRIHIGNTQQSAQGFILVSSMSEEEKAELLSQGILKIKNCK